jgi:ABC-type polar amino acid transport system ATPase subunit
MLLSRSIVEPSVLMGDVVSGPGVDVNLLRRRVGMVFQAYNLFPHMTVLQNIIFGPTKLLGQKRSLAEEQAKSLLERVNLLHRAGYYPDLSGGQEQRVAIVRAIAYKERNIIERFFNKLKQFRRVATRYDKLLANFMGFVKLAAIAVWLK